MPSEASTNAASKFSGVLIVDDDPVLVAITEMFFQKRGAANVHSAHDGAHGLEVLDRYSDTIDFILCDLNMPQMDGIQFLRHLKDRNYRGHLAILSGEQSAILKTAKGLAQSHNLNIVGALTKPLKIYDLEVVLAELNAPHNEGVPTAPVLATVHDLRHALVNGSVVPYFQPKVSVEKRLVCGAEALARWIHPSLGVIGPNFFIPMAEQNGLMGQLTQKMFDQAIASAVMWGKRAVAPKVSVNIGSESLNRIEFPDQIAAQIGAAGLECTSFVLEITERQLVEKNATSSEVLARLRIMGFGISIDDFGTGYSNIEQLREFPFTELKIDQSFIREASHDQFARTSVEASTNLGKQLGLRLVAEGVETEEDWQFVSETGIDEVQGYYVAKPMPADEFADWVLQYEGRGTFDLRQPELVSGF